MNKHRSYDGSLSLKAVFPYFLQTQVGEGKLQELGTLKQMKAVNVEETSKLWFLKNGFWVRLTWA